LFPLFPLSQTFAVLKRVTIVPDDFYDLVGRGALACVWQDHMSAQRLPGGGGTRAV
jgi:hypothetical protein